MTGTGAEAPAARPAGQVGGLSLAALAWGWRDRILADARFQRVTARLPLVGGVARREAARLFDICAGFIYAQTLSACVSLDLFEFLAGRRVSLTEIAARCDLPERGAEALLEAACALRLLSVGRDGRYGLGMLGAALRGNPGISAMVRHHAALYADLRDPVAVLREGGAGLGAIWPYARAGAADGAGAGAGDSGPYTALMAASQPMIADAVLACVSFGGFEHLLDVGGGSGRFVEAVGRAWPGLRLSLLDLPEVAAAAEARLAASGMGARVRCLGGNFRAGSLPRGADLISFIRVLHDHDDSVVADLLARARAALPDHGAVLVAEPMADEPRAAAYFSVYLRAMGSGRPRRARRLAAMLRAAGFGRVRQLRGPMPLLTRVIVADCKS